MRRELHLLRDDNTVRAQGDNIVKKTGIVGFDSHPP
jgi:hypothetical protein